MAAIDRPRFPLGETRRHLLGAEPSPEVQSLPFYRYVPKDHYAQLEWRRLALLRSAEDKQFRFALWEAAEADVLFFFNTFLWLHEPRLKHKRLPFNTWPDQDDDIVWMESCWGVRNCAGEKSREIGFSYDICGISFRHWLLDKACEIAVISKDRDAVDSPRDPSSFMRKYDYMYAHLPPWWRYQGRFRSGQGILDRTTTDSRFFNQANGSIITGYASTGDATAGGRKTAIILDEFAKFPPAEAKNVLDATQHVTWCRYFISAFDRNSRGTEFYKMVRIDHKKIDMLKIEADWRDNPARARGLYRSDKGQFIPLDREFWTLERVAEYRPILDGRTRSPWYDAKCCEAGATSESIAAELDRNPLEAAGTFFTVESVQKALEHTATPVAQGTLDYDTETFEPTWIPGGQGRVLLWRCVTDDGRISYGGPYLIGVDIAIGNASAESSYSAIVVFDLHTREQVLEYSANDIKPEDLAELVYAMCLWLAGENGSDHVRLNFDRNGPPGVSFWNRMLEIGPWPNFLIEPSETKYYKRLTDRPGYQNQDGGEKILGALRRALVAEEVIIRSERILNECLEYQFIEDKLVHISSHHSRVGGQRGKRHGDLAIAAALAWMAHQESAVNDEGKPPENLPHPIATPDDYMNWLWGKDRTRTMAGHGFWLLENN